ncbi:Protein of uncharacterised function (DUF2459) [Kingella potus]|uniref:Protein of uncharacterized function (DUF2459) n=1 Tax=Kingella potus TaxID=265175 RepID=A0A377QY07_9NEIS|nr:TIGR02117 family protein [Kingella potus]STQ99882.1 Protein of uncharacterised function (DUF2459) [Kingella potus]
MRTLRKILIRATLALLAAAAAYFAAAWLLSSVVMRENRSGSGITLYLRSNGAHADIVMPLANGTYDWRTVADPAATAAQSKAYRYIAVGWGERDFYLNTPRWRDLTAATAVRALSGANRTLIHTAYSAEPPAEGAYAVRFTVSHEQYRRLAENLAAHFKRRNGRTLPVSGAHYTPDDAFYEAEGRYHLFNTCNSWLNRRLAESGLRSVVWTPFAAPLLDAYRQP